MKRKLIKRSTKKYNYLFSHDDIWLSICYEQKIELEVMRKHKKYNDVLDFPNAYKSHASSTYVMVPILTSSKNKRSRIQNECFGYRFLSGIKEFNELSGLNLKLSDIKVKR